MSRWTPRRRRDFINKIGKIGFNGPYSGARHQFMVYKTNRLAIPSNSEYSVPQLRKMVNEVEDIIGREISLEEWIDL